MIASMENPMKIVVSVSTRVSAAPVLRGVAVVMVIVLAGAGCVKTAAAPRPMPALDIRPDKTVFTVFAFLNAAGWIEENNPGGMHPVRSALRAYLAEHVAAASDSARSYYRAHPASTWAYSVVAMATDGPPAFRPAREWDAILGSQELSRLSALPERLREFYRAAGIDSLFRAADAAHDAEIGRYREAVRVEVDAVLKYMRVPPASAGRGGDRAFSVVVPNLLGSYESALSFVLLDTLYAVEGPQRAPGYNPHEFIHAITNAISYDTAHTAAQQKAAELFAAVSGLPAIRGRYRSLAHFLDENLVRAVALRYVGARDPSKLPALSAAMMEEYRSGYILERYFFESLAQFEAQDQPLTSYYATMLQRLDPAAELARWNSERAPRR